VLLASRRPVGFRSRMLKRSWNVFALLALGLSLLSVTGCCGVKENTSASAKCRGAAPNQSSCDACCKGGPVGAKYGTYTGGACHCY
jgi:hypothetical protein